VAGNLPDFDRNVAKKLGVKRRDHHRWVSHSFTGWAPPSALALRAAGDRPLVKGLVACLWGHLLLDTYADGIAWLWPLTERKIGLFQRPEGIRDRGWATPAPLTTKVGKVEAAFWAVAALGAARSALWR
jgi:LexA-binding, inner membrane-associated putative hydrolase